MDLEAGGGAGAGAANCCQNKSSAEAVGAGAGVEARVEAGGSVVVVVGAPDEVVGGSVVGEALSCADCAPGHVLIADCGRDYGHCLEGAPVYS